MKTQNFNNHVRYYPPHHFFLLPMLFILLLWGIYKSVTENDYLNWLLFSIVIFFILFIAVILRQHYAITLQNRIVKLEFRQRYFEFTGEKTENIINKLSFSQIAALRFSSDEEFLDLVHKTGSENLSGKEIKKNIKNWRADYDRV